MTEHGPAPDIDIEAMAREVHAARTAFCRGSGMKPSHLTPWEALSAWDQEADRVMARALIAARDAQWQSHLATRAGAEVQGCELLYARAFVERVNARAEARMQAGNPLEGSHWLSMQAELKAMEQQHEE